MLIEREHYLELLRQTEYLAQENEVLLRENTILAGELERQRVVNYELMHRFEEL